MTIPDERTRALLWAGGFLIELARDARLPMDVRQRAVIVARHFPTVEDITVMAQVHHLLEHDVGLALPNDVAGWEKEFRFGSLRSSTRFDWPEASLGIDECEG